MSKKFANFTLFMAVSLVMAVLPVNASMAIEAKANNGKPNVTLKVAVASNFATTARDLVHAYSLISNDAVQLLVGATGKHASQISHGLKVDVFLAADVDRPKFLEDRGLAVSGTRFTYAVGRLVLWSKDSSLVDSHGNILRLSTFEQLAIANPKTAPYGVAAMEVLSELGISPSLVRGESVGQAFLFANSGNAELALIALAQIKHVSIGSRWLVPSELHQPIEQQAVLINDSLPARDFLSFLRSEQAVSIIESNGYSRPDFRAETEE